jgi:hypothetical protein
MKKILIGFAVLVVLLLSALVAIPYFFKDEIIAQIKKAANENLTATLDFTDVNLSVFSHFPQISVGLKDLEITGSGPFDGVKLVQCDQLDLAIDIWSAVFGKQVIIKGLYFDHPDIKVYVLKDGTANYSITKPAPPPDPTSTTSPSSPIKLEHYEITKGKILYDDRSLGMKAELNGLDHSGKGEFATDLYDLTMKTTVEQLSVNYGGVQYLKNAKADWQTTIGADTKNMKFTFKDNEMKVNALALMLNGWLQMPNSTDYLMDLTFGTPANTFKSLLSIVPGAYTKDFDNVKANGTVQFAGFAKGRYNAKTYPAFKLDFKVGNADFQYPSLPLGVSNINVDASINSPSSNLNDMTVNIPKFSLKIGSNPLEGYFNLKTPETNPTVDMKMNGTLNLGELSKAFPMDGVQELAGIIKANMTLKASMNQVETKAYDQVQMAGDFGMENISYKATGMPPVKINALQSSLTPQQVNIKQFDAKLGKSDLQASGTIDNILAYFSTKKTMTGTVHMNSNYFDADEWMETPAPAPATTSTGAPKTASKVPSDVPAASEKAFDRWDFTMDGKIGKLKYSTYDISDLSMKGHFLPNKMDVSEFGMKLGASDLRGSGHILNAWNYMFDKQTVAGVINLQSTYFNLNQFMTPPPKPGTAGPVPAAPPAAEAIIPVPENMDMTVNANFGKVKYSNLDLDNLNGQVLVKNRVATLKDCTAKVLGGGVALNGDYDTRDLSKPKFNMDLALQNMGFKDAFQNFLTVKTLAPVAQLIDGKFNTSLSMTGLLGKDMTPDLNTMSAAGFLETINAVINNFKPLSDIGSKLNLSYLSKMELGNSKNWFEIKNGTVTVKPFKAQVRDIGMLISGSHSLANEMNYQIDTKTPRKALGGLANGGLDFLSKEASKYGVSLAQGEFVNVRFNITGSFANPKLGFKVLGSDGQATIQDQASNTAKATVEKAKDSLAHVASKELNTAKDKAAAAAQKAADSLRHVAEREVQIAKDKAAQAAKDQATKVLGKEVGDKVGKQVGDQVGQKAGQVLGDKGQKTVEDAKQKLETWDPFKKKKN